MIFLTQKNSLSQGNVDLSFQLFKRIKRNPAHLTNRYSG